MKCYICFEETWMKSPCFCQTPVHQKCLLTWTAQSQRQDCSICAHRLHSPILLFQSGLHAFLRALKKVFMVMLVLLSIGNGDRYKETLEPLLFGMFVGMIVGHYLECFIYRFLNWYCRFKTP